MGDLREDGEEVRKTDLVVADFGVKSEGPRAFLDLIPFWLSCGQCCKGDQPG